MPKNKAKTNTLSLYMHGFITGGKLISGGPYIWSNIFVSKWMGLYPGGLKTGGEGGRGGFNVGFYGILLSASAPCGFMYFLLTITTYHKQPIF